MTRKDYELISASLKWSKPCKIAKPKGYEHRLTGWVSTVECLADWIAQDNKSFNRAKFLAHAGVTEAGETK